MLGLTLAVAAPVPRLAYAGPALERVAPSERAAPITIQRPKRAAPVPAPSEPVAAPTEPVTAPQVESAPAPAPEPVPAVQAQPEAETTGAPELVLALAPMQESPTPARRSSVDENDAGELVEYKHHGFVLGTSLGPMGCTREVCSSSGHKASPGVRIGGFVGGNIKGRVELGMLGGWGRMKAGLEDNTSVLGLYGVPAGQVSLIAQALGLAPAHLYANDADLQVGHLAPVLRVHFPKQGRVAAYVGAGVGWSTFRARYRGGPEDFKLAFGGIDLPAQVGAMYYLSKRVAVGASVEYRWTHWVTLRIDHPERSLLAPLRTVRNQAESNGLDFDPQLPHMWMASLALRLTL